MPDPENSEVIRNIPLIPLRDLVVFPATLVPFIVGRPSSIQALEKAAEKDKMIFLAAQMDASIDNPSPKDIYSMGVTAKIIRTVQMDDKNVKVIVEGKQNLRAGSAVRERAGDGPPDGKAGGRGGQAVSVASQAGAASQARAAP